ncbi:Zn-ribbon domain-containing OB-fold protein [Hoeflea sp.]|uniref:Zn-ribbon domain-containing OB-fold protein n=1 Tax=Hoeflea sp. TaxID=1940281 RepID=UPI003B52215B
MDPTLGTYWQGVDEGRVLIQRCSACGAHQFPPRPFCLSCDADAPEWIVASRKGVVYSITKLHSPPERGQAVALIALHEGPRLLAVADVALRIEDTVQVHWETDAAGRPRLRAAAI